MTRRRSITHSVATPRLYVNERSSTSAQSVREPRSPILAATLGEGDLERAGIAHEDDEAFATGDRRVEEVLREHDEMGGQEREDHGRVLAPLGLVDRAGIGER